MKKTAFLRMVTPIVWVVLALSVSACGGGGGSASTSADSSGGGGGSAGDGKTYSELSATGLSGTITAVNGDSSHLYVGTESGLYVSTDGGNTFSSAATLGTDWIREVFVDSSTSPATVYVADQTASKIYTSTNGSTWTAVNPGISSVTCVFANGVNIYVGGSSNGGLAVSTNGGSSWADASLSSNYVYGVYATAGGILYVSTGSGLESGTVGSATFTADSGVTQYANDNAFYASQAAGSSEVYMGTSSSGLVLYETGTADSATTSNGLASNKVTAVVAPTSNDIYAATDNGSNYSLSYSSSGGGSFTTIQTVSSLIGAIYVSGSKVYYSSGSALYVGQ